MISQTPLVQDDRHSIKQAERSCALMTNLSRSLGLNCDDCHDTRAFAEWSQSPPQRTTAGGEPGGDRNGLAATASYRSARKTSPSS